MSLANFVCNLCTGGKNPGTPNEDLSGDGSAGLVIASYDQSAWGDVMKAKILPVLDPEKVTYEEFFNRYLLKNLPCMFSSGLTGTWMSIQFWRGGGGAGEEEDIDFEYLVKVYGNAEITAVNCDDKEYKEGYGTRDCQDMTFKEYVEYWKDCIASGHRSTKPCLYLKDWHIVRFHNSVGEDSIDDKLPYQTPIFFQSDWLNEICDEKDEDDFKFCYMGPKGSFTSFHADVYGSYSWSANIVGVKKWFLYPPGKELRFYKAGKLVFNWEDPGVCGEDYIEVIQKAGECLFVPSGWHHVVWNMTDCVSINHNWLNGANISYIWAILQKGLKDVETELEDLSDIPEFFEQCQLVLKANHGMNYEGFLDILERILKNRLNPQQFLKPQQAQFDIDAVKHVILEHCMKDSCFRTHFAKNILQLTSQFFL